MKIGDQVAEADRWLKSAAASCVIGFPAIGDAESLRLWIIAISLAPSPKAMALARARCADARHSASKTDSLVSAVTMGSSTLPDRRVACQLQPVGDDPVEPEGRPNDIRDQVEAAADQHRPQPRCVRQALKQLVTPHRTSRLLRAMSLNGGQLAAHGSIITRSSRACRKSSSPRMERSVISAIFGSNAERVGHINDGLSLCATVESMSETRSRYFGDTQALAHFRELKEPDSGRFVASDCRIWRSSSLTALSISKKGNGGPALGSSGQGGSWRC